MALISKGPLPSTRIPKVFGAELEWELMRRRRKKKRRRIKGRVMLIMRVLTVSKRLHDEVLLIGG